MKNFLGFASNGEYSVGCTGQTVYLFDKNGTQINKFKGLSYAYLPVISPDGMLFVVKTTQGKLAVYSLESFSLMKKFSFSKIHHSQDEGCCFSPDGKKFFNIEKHGQELLCAISVYDTADFLLSNQLFLEEGMKIWDIEFDEETKEYFVLGYVRGDDGYGFVAKYKDNSITDIIKITKKNPISICCICP